MELNKIKYEDLVVEYKNLTTQYGVLKHNLLIEINKMEEIEKLINEYYQELIKRNNGKINK